MVRGHIGVSMAKLASILVYSDPSAFGMGFIICVSHLSSLKAVYASLECDSKDICYNTFYFIFTFTV